MNSIFQEQKRKSEWNDFKALVDMDESKKKKNKRTKKNKQQKL